MIGDSIDVILITSLNYLGLSRYPCFKTVLNGVGKIRALIYFLYNLLLHILFSTHISPWSEVNRYQAPTGKLYHHDCVFGCSPRHTGNRFYTTSYETYVLVVTTWWTFLCFLPLPQARSHPDLLQVIGNEVLLETFCAH